MRSFLLTLIAAGFLVPATASAAATDSAERGSDLIFLPLVYYTPETRSALVLTGIYTRSASSPAVRPSSLMAFLTYTQENQRMVRLAPDIYTTTGWRISGGLGAMDFPDKFYGVGSDTLEEDEEDYTQVSVSLEASVQREVFDAFYIGVRVDHEDLSVEDIEAGGLLDTGPVPGAGGGAVSGAGILLTWDRRDDLFWPSRGLYAEAAAMVYGEGAGGDFSYDTLALDLRQYTSTGRVTLAFQQYLHLSGGDPPFHRLAQLGGSRLMRGYFMGRFRDRNMGVLQAESRLLLSPKWALALFGGAGAVAPAPGELTAGAARTSFGAGIRYRLGRKEAVNLRVDVARGEEGSSGVYFMIREAF